MNLEETINKLKLLFMILVIFILGFLLGYWAKNVEYEEKLYRNAIEITDLKESVDRLEQMKNLE